jgi:hypothetical protein
MLDHPIETFLFETRYGFCSHYAAAFTYLMRVAQIPARVVMGYQGGELNKLGNFLEIRQSDAHAWSEVWLANKGWVRFDPTAAIAQERIEEGNAESMISSEGLITFNATSSELSNWLKTMQQAWRSVDYRWQSWVINYNSANQAKFLANFFGIHNIESMLRVLLIGVAIIGGLAGLFLLRGQRKTTDKVLRLYHRYNKKLERLGMIRASHEGAIDFARRAQAQLPQHAQQIAQISDLFVALRYGKQPQMQDMKKLKQLIAGFKV